MPIFGDGGGGGNTTIVQAAPDFQGAAQAQGQSAQQNIAAQTFANRPTIRSPFGTVDWSKGLSADPATGLPVTEWGMQVGLTPEQQAAKSAQDRITMARSGVAENLLGQAGSAVAQPADWSTLPGTTRGVEDPWSQVTAARAGNINEAQQGAYQKMAAMLEPQRTQEREALETRAANMGLPENSEAYKRLQQQQSDRFSQQDKMLLAQALQEGRLDVSAQQGLRTAQLGEGVTARGTEMTERDQQLRERQQAIADMMTQRGAPLNEVNAWMAGQQVQYPAGVGAPPTTTAQAAAATPYLGAATGAGQFGLGQMQAGQQSGGGSDWGSGLSGIASLLGSGAALYTAFSDRRLKTDVKFLGRHPNGVGIYEFVMFGVKQVGVMAQELAGVRPDLVHVHPSGYLMVNYAGL